MFIASWFRFAVSGSPSARSLNGRRRRRHAQRASGTPHLEYLEDRTLLNGATAGTRQLLQAYGQLPLSFEANHGQTAAQVNFLSRGQGYTLFLTPTEAVLALDQGSGLSGQQSAEQVLQMQLVGASPRAQAVGLDQQAGVSNYFLGNHPSQWITGVAHYGKVEYQDLYSGINLIYYGNNQTHLEYDFDVAPGASPAAIQLAFHGAVGVTLDGQGDLVLHTAAGDVTERAPVAYQVVAGVRHTVAVRYVLEANGQVGFALGAYDPSQALVIDPVLSYSTYLGGTTGTSGGEQEGNAIAVDSSGDAYVTGSTVSTAFPTTAGAFQTTNTASNGVSSFVTKLNATGTALVYSTYLGQGVGTGIAVNSAGDAYVTGWTAATNFPTTTGAFQTTAGFASSPLGGTNAFVTELNASGSGLVYSTYLGGTGTIIDEGLAPYLTGDSGSGIAQDSAGDAYITGYTQTTNFPTTAGAFQTTLAASPSESQPGSANAFVTELNPAGSALVYSTYLGGSSTDHGTGIAVDSSGDAYITGYSNSSNFPTTPGAFQTTSTTSGGSDDAFVTELNASGSALVYSTFLGGSGGDNLGYGIAVDSAGNAYVTGVTYSTTFPTTAGAFQTTNLGAAAGGCDAFVTKLNAAGSGLVYSSYLGGSAANSGRAIAVDSAGDAYVTGQSLASNFPTTAGAFETTGSGAFVTEFNSSGAGLVYSTYVGGNTGYGIAVDNAGDIYVTGWTGSGFPTTAGAFQTTYVAGKPGEAFVAKFAAGPYFAIAGFPSPTTAGVAGTITVTALNANGTVNTGYTGTVHFTSSDPQAVLPADYTFTAADQGVHTFSVTLKTAGTQSIAATDTANSSTVGNDVGISVTPAAAATLVYSSVPASTTAGSAFSLTLTAKDAYGNVATGYTGTVHFSSSDPKAVLPANYAFTSGDAGKHTFSVTLKTAGTQAVTATDTRTSSVTDTASGIVVKPSSSSKFLLSAPSSVRQGVPFSVTLTVEDAYGNVATGYTGTVQFSTSDSTATLPANYTFTAADAGVHTFAGVVLRKKGKQTLTVTDTLNSALTVTDTISVV